MPGEQQKKGWLFACENNITTCQQVEVAQQSHYNFLFTQETDQVTNKQYNAQLCTSCK